MRKKYQRVFFDQIRKRGWNWGIRQGINYFQILLSAAAGRPLTGPISAVLMLTYRCNHRCRMCDFPARAEPDRPEMDTARAKELISEIAALGTSGISFYGGEPLLRNDLVELVAWAGSLGLTIHLTTNGYLMTRGLAEDLISAGVNLFTISLDGATAEVNDRQRGVAGAFQRAVEAIGHIRAAREKLKLDTRLAVASTLTPDNLGELDDLIALVRRLGVDSYTVFEAQTLATLPNQFSSGEMSQLRRINDALRGYKSRFPDFIDNSQTYLRLVEKMLAGKAVRLKCFAPYTDIFIDPYQMVFPCTYFLGLNQPIGKLIPGKLSEFWSSADYKKTRKSLARCGRCNYLCHRELSLLFNRAWPLEKPVISSFATGADRPGSIGLAEA